MCFRPKVMSESNSNSIPYKLYHSISFCFISLYVIGLSSHVRQAFVVVTNDVWKNIRTIGECTLLFTKQNIWNVFALQFVSKSLFHDKPTDTSSCVALSVYTIFHFFIDMNPSYCFEYPLLVFLSNVFNPLMCAVLTYKIVSKGFESQRH